MSYPTSTTRLLEALQQTNAPNDIIERAKANHYHDYLSSLATPCIQLVNDLRSVGLHDLASRAANGEFDATKEESDEWARSPEGQETINSLPPQMRKMFE